MSDSGQKKIRYGIVGFGSFAERSIAPAIRASSNSELVAIQKRSLRAAREKAAEHHIPFACNTVEDLVAHDDVDAVFIVSANSAHCAETLAAARAKKHVLVEKPMAMNVAEVRKMMEACRKNRVKLMVGHMIRFSPLVLRIRELVRADAIGAVTFARAEFVYDGSKSQRKWLWDQKVAGGGPLFDIGVHCLDTLRFVLEDEAVSVKSHLAPVPTKTRTESTADLALRFSGGTLASIYCSFAASIRRSTIEILGTKGSLFANQFTLGSRKAELTVTSGDLPPHGEQRVETIDVPNLYVEEINHFSSCILNNTKPSIPGEVGLENQRVLDEALKGGR
ncbi:MAG TPA: Gfo/Idh/MocA family oxidoreductase [Bacteroidota bacterium]|nr:Gfo/Idh/MocA family oxidoreductase [Bacteroidota bacterium]